MGIGRVAAAFQALMTLSADVAAPALNTIIPFDQIIYGGMPAASAGFSFNSGTGAFTLGPGVWRMQANMCYTVNLSSVFYQWQIARSGLTVGGRAGTSGGSTFQTGNGREGGTAYNLQTTPAGTTSFLVYASLISGGTLTLAKSQYSYCLVQRLV